MYTGVLKLAGQASKLVDSVLVRGASCSTQASPADLRLDVEMRVERSVQWLVLRL